LRRDGHCRDRAGAVDEGSLTGTLTKQSKWPEGDWRNIYFVPENLIPTVERADALKPIAARAEINMPEMAFASSSATRW